ncbi:MAG: tRNA threonylcarbamoyladenosine dehydratase [Catonella sp.]|nr:tRNA threonylcarbamoyladenosine dehydratase [Catonella sp.]MDY6355848.1 tRNA threonylcarbamoyladenosine dehydratase [Catonella sp.]
MLNQFSRTALLFGNDGIEKLKASRVIVFGLGGVGGYVCEALVRSGVGTLDIVDDDRICLTNLNRQIFATRKTIGKYKVDACEERMKEINPDVVINKHPCFYTTETENEFDFSEYDYVVDAIDTVTGKILIIMNAQKAGTPVISAMGAGYKLDPTQFRIADIYDTKMDPLAKVMRHELKKRGVKKLNVVYSEEKPLKVRDAEANSCRTQCVCPPGTVRKCSVRRDIPGSNSFVPSAAGLIIASKVIRDIVGM